MVKKSAANKNASVKAKAKTEADSDKEKTAKSVAKKSTKKTTKKTVKKVERVEEPTVSNVEANTEILSSDEKKELYSTIAKAQLNAWKKGSGHFYWNYKYDGLGRNFENLTFCLTML